MKAPNSVLSGYGTKVFEVMSRLVFEHPAIERRAINPGQGFADADGPVGICKAAAAALVEGPNQFPRRLARRPLRETARAPDHLRSGRVSIKVASIESKSILSCPLTTRRRHWCRPERSSIYRWPRYERSW